ncbi:MAG TPA: DUF3617 family protein, partial [Allosphingosinicella sp.]|nr:DUF3617 family protein [Allosphingosinicella sp.]
AEADAKKPPANLLAGIENASCQYDNFYMSNGRINAAIACTRPDLKGRVMVSTNGSYTEHSFDLDSDVATSLTTDGDIQFAAKVTGRHAGACKAEGATKG